MLNLLASTHILNRDHEQQVLLVNRASGISHEHCHPTLIAIKFHFVGLLKDAVTYLDYWKVIRRLFTQPAPMQLLWWCLVVDPFAGVFDPSRVLSHLPRIFHEKQNGGTTLINQ